MKRIIVCFISLFAMFFDAKGQESIIDIAYDRDTKDIVITGMLENGKRFTGFQITMTHSDYNTKIEYKGNGRIEHGTKTYNEILDWCGNADGDYNILTIKGYATTAEWMNDPVWGNSFKMPVYLQCSFANIQKALKAQNEREWKEYGNQ